MPLNHGFCWLNPIKQCHLKKKNLVKSPGGGFEKKRESPADPALPGNWGRVHRRPPQRPLRSCWLFGRNSPKRGLKAPEVRISTFFALAKNWLIFVRKSANIWVELRTPEVFIWFLAPRRGLSHYLYMAISIRKIWRINQWILASDRLT